MRYLHFCAQEQLPPDDLLRQARDLGHRRRPSTLDRYVHAIGCRVEYTLVPEDEGAR